MKENEKNSNIVLAEGQPDDVGAGHLQLPFTKSNFAGFVSSLLGSPQSIERKIRGPFCLDAEDVRQTHLLLEQRINQQNEGVPVRFHAQIEFADAAIVRVNSIESLLAYRNIKDIETVRLLLVWDYLISFPKKGAPEKQTIEISIRARPMVRDVESEEDFVVRIGEARTVRGIVGISINVRYTERTWGEDIMSLLTNHFESKIGRLPKWREFLSHYAGASGTTAGVVVYLLMLIAVFRSTLLLAERNAEEAKKILDASYGADAQVRAGVEYLMRLQAEGVWAQHFLKIALLLVFGIPIAIILGSWVGSSMAPGHTEPRFILFPYASREAREYYQKYIASSPRATIVAIVVSFLVGIVSNVASSYII